MARRKKRRKLRRLPAGYKDGRLWKTGHGKRKSRKRLPPRAKNGRFRKSRKRRR